MSNPNTISGPTDFVFVELVACIDGVLIDEAKREGKPFDPEASAPIANWAWKHHASSTNQRKQFVEFSYDGTWDDLVDSYYEDALSDYNESRIG